MNPSETKPIGLYLHIPFCRRKCPYCDFFSVCDDRRIEEYTGKLCNRLEEAGKTCQREADTVYFGGGTPSLLGAERLCRILEKVYQFFGQNQTEITLEVNPEKKDLDFSALRRAGFNRLSIGLQSANDRELQLLGRLHDKKDAENCIRAAQQAGFENLSLDLMVATPSQTRDSLLRSIDFCAEHGARHISAYLLKIEEGTPFAVRKEQLSLCTEDEQAERYLLAAEALKAYGYRQYEISNFSLEGYESRHNLKYWHDEEYLGLGPAAHSFLNGRRFFFGRSFEDFYEDHRVADGSGGDEEEFMMLGLRLSEGITEQRFRERFRRPLPAKYRQRGEKLVKAGYLEADEQGIRLTTRGFLLSNAIIAALLD